MTRLNWKIRIPLSKVILTPYRKIHVEIYHRWMMDPELLEATASEPLTLNEEYENQQSWRDDPNKVTFIINDRETKKPVGDVNLFLHQDDKNVPEINIMIAESSSRKKGLAQQALAGMILFARDVLQVKQCIAKIDHKNIPSIKLFTKLGFTQTSKDDTFQEITMTSSNTTFGICCTLAGVENENETIKTEVDVDPQVDLFRELGNKAFHKSDFINAIKLFDQGLDIDWMDHILLSNRSVARIRGGDFYGAIMDAARAVAIEPTYLKARHRLAASWAAVGLSELGKQAYKEAEIAFPSEADALRDLGNKLSTHRDPRVEDSPRYMNCLKLLPSFVAVHCPIGNPVSPKILLGEVLYLWKRLTGEEKTKIFDVYCEITGASPSEVPTSQQWNKLTVKPEIPGAMEEDQLPKTILSYISAKEHNTPEMKTAMVELLFSSCSLEERNRIARVLVDLVGEALKLR
jgi:RimJ/RimL family protein N-acetyltransferase